MMNFLAFVFVLTASNSVQMEALEEKHEKEVAARGSFSIPSSVSEADLRACIPQESKPFPSELNQKMKSVLFTEKEVEDLGKCNPESCAFNFLPYEKSYFQNLKSDEERKEAFFKFFQDRVRGLTPLDPNREPLFIRNSKEHFPECHSPALDALLKNRSKHPSPFRFSAVRYDEKMRPTARLLKGDWFKMDANRVCYAEAFIFSTHYDDDRVEVWIVDSQSNSTKIELLIRNRIDFLRTWVRRLQKSKLRNQLEVIVQENLEKAQNCLQSRSNGS